MRYDDPQLLDLLAGRYALGSMRATARARLEGLMRRDATLRRKVVDWQERLVPLAAETPEIRPPARVLARLKERIDPRAREAGGWWNRVGFWRPFGAATAALAIAVVTYLGVLTLQKPAPTDPRYIAVLADSSARPAVVVTAFVQPFRLNIEPLAPLAAETGKALQVWAVEKKTGIVRPLTQMAAADAQRIALGETAWKLVRGAESLVVTLETAGSPPPAPTGPILYSGLCINLKGPKTT